MHKLASLSLALCLLGAAPAAADAADAAPAPPPSWVIDVQVANTGGKAEAQFAAQVALVAGSCSEISTWQQEVEYVVQVCDTSRDPSQPLFAFEVSRVERSKTTQSQQRLKVRARIAPGKRATLGSFSRPSGESATVTAGITAVP